MIKVTRPYLVDAIINHPSVRSTAQSGDAPISCENLLEDPENVLYATEYGAVVFVHKGDKVYEGHIFVLEGSRGKQALALGNQAMRRLQTDHQAVKLVAAVPVCLPAARFLCRRLGLRPTGMDDLNEYFEMEFA